MIARLNEWRMRHEYDRATARSWARATTLGELGELTAQWLEQRLAFHPCGYDEPAPETHDLIPDLAALNRAGFVTQTSQPGTIDPCTDGTVWRQRAAVSGYLADPEMLKPIISKAEDAGLWLVAHSPAADRAAILTIGSAKDGPARNGRVPVTTRDDRSCTWFGHRPTKGEIRRTFTGCHRVAIRALTGSLQVTVVDPEWGRPDRLWAALR